MLRTKHRLFSARSDYFDNGQYVATYDGGPCSLIFADGKEYSFSLWTEEWVKDRILPKGTAHIACLIDYNYEIVFDEASADRIHYDNRGGVTYYKEGGVTIVAHSETPLDSKSQWLIVCNRKKYDCIYNEKFFSSLATILENENLIGSIKVKSFTESSRFVKDMPLSERIFIGLLAIPWWQGRELKRS